MRSIKFLALLVALGACAWTMSPRASAQETSVSFQLFYDQLGPYGSWVEYQNYGYVWVPDVDRDFSPYGTNGHWIFTEDGWTWVSDYSWGWAPFHYGRWAYDDSYGWLWVPHNEWGPAWVTWRRSEGYYGWAPMEPGISIDVSFGGGYRVPNDRWIFVRDRDINRPDIDRHYVDRSTNVTIINNSTVINNTYTDNSRHAKYVAGPAKDDVQKATGTPIRPVGIKENDKPGQTLSNDQLKIYRPRVQGNNNGDRKPVPSKLVNLKEVKPVSERRQESQRRNENPTVNKNEQSSQPHDANSSNSKARQQQPSTIPPPNRVQPTEGRRQQPSTTTSPNKVQPTEGRRQQPSTTTSPNKVQQSKPQDVKPSNSRGSEKHQQNVAQPKKSREAQPSQSKTKPKQDKNKLEDKKKRDQ